MPSRSRPSGFTFLRQRSSSRARRYLRPMAPNSLWLLVDLVRSRRPLKDYIQYSPTAQFDLDIYIYEATGAQVTSKIGLNEQSEA